MRKRQLSFKELVIDNKEEIKNDIKAIERIETKIEAKHSKEYKILIHKIQLI